MSMPEGEGSLSRCISSHLAAGAVDCKWAGVIRHAREVWRHMHMHMHVVRCVARRPGGHCTGPLLVRPVRLRLGMWV